MFCRYGYLIALLCSGVALAQEEPQKSCGAKLAAIEAQLTEAKAVGNQAKANGLAKALEAAVAANCEDDPLYAERLAKVEAKEAKLVERQNELSEAIASGQSMEKITKKRQKVAEAQAELHQAQAELEQ
ncbi:DUF1090 domain-containing protein [Shewanella sp.]|uniref:DUF1090 domain-containing protein n=1 Tax=Shewanella sp. TaxID=50422 RepID=UPI003A8BE411